MIVVFRRRFFRGVFFVFPAWVSLGWVGFFCDSSAHLGGSHLDGRQRRSAQAQ